MAYDQRLISRDGIFASCWIAGTTTNGLVEALDIEAVNIPQTCDQLRSATTHRCAKLTHLESVETAGKIPFRIVTNLCYGTIRIYQKQVDNLLKRSEELLVRSGNGMPSMRTTKRRASSISATKTVTCKGPGGKKQRIVQSTQNTVSDYSELLDEAESWMKADITPLEEPLKDVASVNHSKFSRLQIREITVREISAEFAVPGLDEDSGFGNATNDELVQFANLFADKLCLPSAEAKKSLKRKTSDKEISIEKRAKLTRDSTIEAIRCAENISDDDSGLYCNGTIENSPQQMVEPTTAVGIEIAEANADDMGAYMSPIKRTTNNNDEAFTVESIAAAPKRVSKLIYDRNLMIDSNIMRLQIENGIKVMNTTKQNFKRDMNRKKIRSSSDLLNHLNRSIFPKSKYALQRYRFKRPNSFERNAAAYLNILRDILCHDVDNILAGSIYANWNVDAMKSAKNKLGETELVDKSCDTHQIVEVQDENFNIVFQNTKKSNCNNIAEELEENIPEQINDGNSLSSCNEEWRPYAIMIKLLNIWRTFGDGDGDSIPAKRLLFSAPNRISAALCFASLLVLTGENFIIVTKKSQSIEMAHIKLGAASNRLIQEIAPQF